MNDNILIEKKIIDCPICETNHEIEKRQRKTQALFKGTVVDYIETYFICIESDCEDNEFVPAYLMDENLLKIRNAYREKKGLLTSQEISDIRKYYGLTQSEYSFLLGWGEVTVTRYESKTIQDETYDNIMRLSFENPMFALECLEKRINIFSPDRYARIRETIIKRIDENANFYFVNKQIKSLYVNYDNPNEFNGNRIINVNKIADLLCYFATNMPNLYKVKLMKLLWYTDAVFFSRHNVSMTGLVYTHMPLGALPVAYNEILMLPTISLEEELINDNTSYKICPRTQKLISEFTADEQEVINLVCKKFKNFNTTQIVDYMHEEIAYKETKPKENISYSLSQNLNELC